jgi:hypothetical protein
MDKAKMLKVLNPILFLCILIQGLSVLIKSVTGYNNYTDILINVHTYNGYVFFGLLLFHLYLNWTWIKTNILRIKKKP